MAINTAVHTKVETADTRPRAPIAPLDSFRWKPRHLLSTFSDRRPIRKIGGLGAYLTQVGWSLWWALRSAA